MFAPRRACWLHPCTMPCIIKKALYVQVASACTKTCMLTEHTIPMHDSLHQTCFTFRWHPLAPRYACWVHQCTMLCIKKALYVEVAPRCACWLSTPHLCTILCSNDAFTFRLHLFAPRCACWLSTPHPCTSLCSNDAFTCRRSLLAPRRSPRATWCTPPWNLHLSPCGCLPSLGTRPTSALPRRYVCPHPRPVAPCVCSTGFTQHADGPARNEGWSSQLVFQNVLQGRLIR